MGSSTGRQWAELLTDNGQSPLAIDRARAHAYLTGYLLQLLAHARSEEIASTVQFVSYAGWVIKHHRQTAPRIAVVRDAPTTVGVRRIELPGPLLIRQPLSPLSYTPEVRFGDLGWVFVACCSRTPW